ncbi:unnamed protein product [Rotaria sp. Silwood2]|nr:unnamed protein product [Rotaria sp. Silwood2]CAF2744832.1 unnamed protein product [Rotaria sp. Silwood2]CAF3159257.1 unnamed protein product [Rotaria sp. Silwood2]CAF3343768.1 unnamed protein product [Rotaria sp. Silwood2]CAF4046136.1 unnamed protein product [Rotaria sp. Silwood2]
MFKSAIILSQQYNMTVEGKLIEWYSVQTGGDVISVLRETCNVLSGSNIVGIVGPGLSREAHLIASFARRIGIPVISYSATDPDLSDRNFYSNFYRTVPSDKTGATAIVKLFKRFNWTSSIIIYQNDPFGIGGSKVITEEFLKNNMTVRHSIMFHISTLSIQDDCKKKLMESESRIIILWVQSNYIPILLKEVLEFDTVGPEYIWILSSSISLDSFDKKYYEKLIGLLTIEPVAGITVNASINTTLLNAAYNIWQNYESESFPGSSKVNSFALFAFDATWSLIKSLQKLCSTTENNSSSSSSFSSSCLSFIESPLCFDRRFSQSDLLLKTINQIEFLGVSGDIKFDSNNLTDRVNGSYYYVQNLQSFSNSLHFVPVLEYGNSGDWTSSQQKNTIFWPGNSTKIPADHAMLEGKTLEIIVFESMPFTIITNFINESGHNESKLIGFIPDLIELLEKRMGFNARIKTAPLNQTYAGLIEDVANDKYDVVFGDVRVTAKRKELVAFSIVIFDNSLRIITRRTSDINIDFLLLLKPFSHQLWLLVFGACIYAAFVLFLIERQDNETLQNRSILSQFLMSVWYSFGNMVGYGVDFNVSTAAGRLLTASLYMLSIVLLAAYTANLASDLTIAKSKYIISGIDDIKSGKIPFNRIGISINTSVEDYYLASISNEIRNFYPLKTAQELYDSLLAGLIDVSLIDAATGEYVTNNIYCNLTLVGDDFHQGDYGIVVKKKWLYTNDLDVNILSLHESGELNELRRKWFQNKTCPDSSETSTALKIRSVGGLFLIFGFISILSFLLFVWSKQSIVKHYFFN